MTADPIPPARTELAELLTDAAQRVSGILTTDYPTAANRSYLHPVLGALSAGPRVVCELNDRLEDVVVNEQLRTPVGLFTLASYASALGWLTESLSELTTSVTRICTGAGILVEHPERAFAPSAPSGKFDFDFSKLEMTAIQTAAEAAGLPPGDYVEALTQSLLAASRITDACMEISSGLFEDAAYVLDEATDDVRIGDGPDSLPTLVRSLLARMGVAE